MFACTELHDNGVTTMICGMVLPHMPQGAELEYAGTNYVVDASKLVIRDGYTRMQYHVRKLEKRG